LINEERREIIKITIAQDPVDQIGQVMCYWKALIVYNKALKMHENWPKNA